MLIQPGVFVGTIVGLVIVVLGTMFWGIIADHRRERKAKESAQQETLSRKDAKRRDTQRNIMNRIYNAIAQIASESGLDVRKWNTREEEIHGLIIEKAGTAWRAGELTVNLAREEKERMFISIFDGKNWQRRYCFADEMGICEAIRFLTEKIPDMVRGAYK